MKNDTLIKAINILILFAVLIATAVIITEVVLGYSGFERINGRNSVIVLQEGCQ